MCFFTRPSTLTAPSVGASDLGAGMERQENKRERRVLKPWAREGTEKGTSASRATFALSYLLRVSFHSFARKACTRCRYACHAAPAEG